MSRTLLTTRMIFPSSSKTGFPVTIAVRPLENSCMIVTRRRFSRTSRVTDWLIVPRRTISRMFFPSTSFAVRPETRRYALLQKRVSALPLVM